MRSTKSVSGLAAGLIGLAGLVGCKAKVAEAPKDLVVAPEVETVEPASEFGAVGTTESLATSTDTSVSAEGGASTSAMLETTVQFGAVKLFYWRADTTGAAVNEVLALAKRMEGLDVEVPAVEKEIEVIRAKMGVGGKREALEKRKADISSVISGLEAELFKQDLTQLKKELAIFEGKIPEYDPKIKEYSDKRDAKKPGLLQKYEAAKCASAPTTGVCKELKRKLDLLDEPVLKFQALKAEAVAEVAGGAAKVEAATAKIAGLNAEIEAKRAEIASADVEIAVINAEVAKYEAELEPVEKSLDEKQAELSAILTRLDALVEMATQKPAALKLKFRADGSATVVIHNWDLELGDGKKTYSSDDGSIQELVFTPKGTIFSFVIRSAEGREMTDASTGEVYRLTETYTFKISRAKAKNGEGRRYMQGDVLRVRVITHADGSVETQKKRGVLKLATL